MKKTEICLHCGIYYAPNRRGVQKFCSNSCRSRFWYLKQNFENRKAKVKDQPKVVEQNSQKDKMSWAGVGNAATAFLIVDLLMKALTKDENKAVTKSVLKKELSNWIGRYHKIISLPPRQDGALPYFDMETKEVVYRKPMPWH